MSTEPSQSERKPLKPGKGYGIAALIFGVVGLFMLLGTILLVLLQDWDLIVVPPGGGFGKWFIAATMLVSPNCAFGALWFGTAGRNTDEHDYANIGLLLSIVYALFMLMFIAYIYANHAP